MKKFLYALIIISIFTTGFINPLHTNNEKNLLDIEKKQTISFPVWPVDKFTTIPFTNFSTSTIDVKLEFKADTLESRFVNHGSEWLRFPKGELPIKLLQVKPDEFVIITRKIFTGELNFIVSDHGILTESPVPQAFSYAGLKDAALLNDELLTILYNPETQTNILLSWKINPDNTVEQKKQLFSRTPIKRECA